MSNSLNVMNTLLGIAKRNLDRAAESLGKANQDVTDAQEQQKRLQVFREEYITQRKSISLEGITATDLKNYELFLKGIDKAIVGQDSVIHQYIEIAKHHTKHWQACQTKKRSYEVIIDRNTQQIQKLSNRRDQKLMDEFSSNQRRFLMAKS
ncbi:flagellar export protein FliJ [Polynucleobacter sp. CS-Odin-A6]|uniref:flagellar export protein FliJ n=1 Tax=Polynucleobacter sp. CS-Odin-A6 TaxID=2689106 RepID=UPI001C0BF3C3|nr:flagellar export protein FliJ [Polynucleobacter sp. CS-Odin-A6]MBU3621847.1 flagellar export protein FliJ [Polynucleobacter sp. CS-Odin-A6]